MSVLSLYFLILDFVQQIKDVCTAQHARSEIPKIIFASNLRSPTHAPACEGPPPLKFQKTTTSALQLERRLFIAAAHGSAVAAYPLIQDYDGPL